MPFGILFAPHLLVRPGSSFLAPSKWAFLGIGVRYRVALTVVAALVGVFGGLGVYTFWYGRGASYFSNDPKACVNCHVMREHYDAWQHASHHAVAGCNDCHMPHNSLVNKLYTKAENGFWHSKAFTLQDFHEPIQIRERNARIVHDNCVRCHEPLIRDLTAHGAFADFRDGCVRCHANVGHAATR
jgi:cytochrome c nitrite reductase small subunit